MVKRESERDPSPVIADLSGSLIDSSKVPASPLRRWGQQAEGLRKEALVFYFAFKHPRVRWYARTVAVCTAAYLVSPIQLIPSYIPVIGFLDDFLVLFLGVKVLRKLVPVDVLTECRQHADAVENLRSFLTLKYLRR